ncbi:MAG: haloacid dehalogenase [Dehalococcoidia bacterium]|nr:haloacid dehalogenase [Dehalococcoidia bacterium]
MIAAVEAIGEKIRAHLTAKYKAREAALQLSREIIRHSANAIRAAHRGDFELAADLLSRARSSVSQAQTVLADFPDIMFAGFLQDAEKEYAEASTTLAIISDRALPDPDEIGVGYVPYLNGLGETAGELRRHALDILRLGDAGRAERLLEAMDDIYAVLVTMDFPDGMTGGLRRTTDLVRGVLEKTRGDLTMILRQKDLEETIRSFEARIQGTTP